MKLGRKLTKQLGCPRGHQAFPNKLRVDTMSNDHLLTKQTIRVQKNKKRP